MLAQETIEKIQTLYANGLSKSAIARQLNISATTITKYTKNIKVVADEMVGKTFGSLLVVKRLEKNPDLASRCIRYLCKCNCGKEVEVNGNSLRTGHTTSCGCSRKRLNQKDLTNLTSGEITFLFPTNERNDGHVIWQCQCSCGKQIKLSSHEFGYRKSCGCIKESLGEKRIQEILKEQGIDFQTQYKFKDCIFTRELPFDFAIFKNEELYCLIEYNGQQHYEITGGWNNEERFREQQVRDFIKQAYCTKYGIKLIIIPYWEYEDITWDYLKGKMNYGLSSNS